MNYTERKITVDAGAGYPVQGVLTLPDGAEPCPAVVLLQGSGPQDYDESVAMNKPFRDIARGLAERGIASIRFTKRTLTYPERIQAKLADLTVREECIDDALAAKSLIAAEPRVDTDRIFLLGHSLGGMLAPRIDAEGGDFRGLIVVAGSPRKLGEIIRDQNLAQLDDLPDNVRESARQQITALLEMFDAFQDMPDEDVKQIDIGGASGYYIKDVDARPASFYLADSVKPILIVQGSKDFQIIADVDFAAYQTLLGDRANATLKLYDGLNHLMMPHVNGTIEDYELPANVDAQVITDVADWILSM